MTSPDTALTLPHESWRAWRRDAQRLLGLLGFKALAIALIVLLLVALWLDGTMSRTEKLQSTQTTSSRELDRMQKLVAMRKKIDANLLEARAAHQAMLQRGWVAATRDEAIPALTAEVQRDLTQQRITDAKVEPIIPSKADAQAPIASLTVTFAAMPDQTVALIRGWQTAGRLLRVRELQLDTSRELEWPRLNVRMVVDGMVFQPPAKSKTGASTAPAAKARP